MTEMKSAGKPVTHIARITGLSRPTIYHVLKADSPTEAQV
ncbi:MAG: helix-turn-helix domain-containing protein [Gemmataceae bacterium]|nr:helix-turn-helix domain-containing protein [Gemmataceae bacterium]